MINSEAGIVLMVFNFIIITSKLRSFYVENKFLRLKNANELFLWIIMLFIINIVSLQIIVTIFYILLNAQQFFLNFYFYEKNHFLFTVTFLYGSCSGGG